MTKSILGVLLAAGLLASPAEAQSSSSTWNDVPDRYQVDVGYFKLKANTILRYDPLGAGSDVSFEKDLGLSEDTNTFWIDGTWRVGRRHQIKLGYTQFSRDRGDYNLQRDFTWGGQDFGAGLNVSSETGADLLGGYYRFAIVRNDRFEIGPSVGIGYLWLSARIRATGTVNGPGGDSSRDRDVSASIGNITGALGGYASGWATKRLAMYGDFLYIKVSPGDSEASVTDWRLGANYYFFRNGGLGVQYKYDKYRYDRGILVLKLGGEVTFEGLQVFLTFRF